MRLVLALLTLTLMALGWAATITIETNPDDPDSQLEKRSIILPDGSEAEYFVIRSSPVTLTIDDNQQLIADVLEVDLTNKVVRIIGFGTIITEEATTQGYNLIFELDDETFQGKDVLIVIGELDVRGVDTYRVPGQISVVTGEFSPCGRCNQQVEDYGFKASRIELFPGDRLVAFDVYIQIRGASVFFVPLLVVPLAPPDRQPQFSVSSGTANRRAEVSLVWPYVAGSAALGTVALRYYADIAVGEGNFFSNSFLGGGIIQSYLGADIDHRFFTDVGQGRFVVGYTPGFLINPRNPTGKTDPRYKLEFRYQTDEALAIPQLNAMILRDDAQRERILEYSLSLKHQLAGIVTQFDSRGFFDGKPEDNVRSPSFGSPVRRLELDLKPETDRYRVSVFQLSTLRLNLGFFEDDPNPSNRSALREATRQDRDGRLLAGRILWQHTFNLEPLRPWSGFELSANSRFQGQYYSTAERLVNWNSNLSLRQNLASFAVINLNFVRDINEGQTPFRFDGLREGNLIYLDAGVEFNPSAWLRLSSKTQYTFLDSRSRGNVGFAPLETQLTLFDNLSWLSLNFRNSYDIRRDDPGTLSSTLELRSPEPSLTASLSATLVTDLQPVDRSGRDNDESELSVNLSYAFGPNFSVRMDGGYIFSPVSTEGLIEYWKPLNLGLGFGNRDSQGWTPGFNLSLRRNLNLRATERLEFEYVQGLRPLEFSLRQTFSRNNQQSSLDSSVYDSATSFALTYRNIATFEANGFEIIPASLLGLAPASERSERWSFSLFESREQGSARWRLSLNTTRNHDDGEVTSSGTNLAAFVNLEETRVGGFYFGLDLNSVYVIRDDAQPLSYLSETNLKFFLDVYATVGFQGSLGYRAIAGLDAQQQPAVTSSSLTLNNVALTLRFLEDWYISAVLDETWRFNHQTGSSELNIQPEFRLVWDRCCWVLYGSWDSKSGAFSITLTTPGASEGLGGVFDTGLRLPGSGGSP